MKKVYTVEESLKFNGERDFNNCQLFGQYVYMDESDATDTAFVINTFENLCSLVEQGMIRNAYMSKTIFGGQPKVVVRRWFGGLDSYKTAVTKKNFIPIEYKFTYTDKSSNNIDTYKEFLTADDFCKYLKDRGITYLA